MMRRMEKAGGLAILAALGLAGCSKETDPKIAAELKDATEAQLKLVEAAGTLSHEAVTVEPQKDGKGYLVSITGLKMASPAVSADFGRVAYVLTPKDDKYAASDCRGPEDIIFKLKSGEELEFKYKLQACTALLTKDLKLATESEFSATDASLGTSKGAVKLGQFHYKVNSADKGNGRYDMNADFTAGPVDTPDDPEGKLHMEQMGVTAKITGFKRDDYLTKIAPLQAAFAKSKMDAASDDPKPTPEQAKALSDMFRAAPGLFAGIDENIEVKGITFTDSEGKKPVSLAKANISFKVDGFDTEKSMVGFGIGQAALKIDLPQMQDPLIAAIVPSDVTFNVRPNDLPTKELTDTFAQILADSAGADPTTMQFQMMGAMGHFSEMMGKAGVTFTIDPSKVVASQVQADIGGSFKVDPAAAYGAAGQLNIGIKGLDAIDKLLQSGQVPKDEAGQASAGLIMLKGLAQRTGDTDQFKIDVGKDKKVTINGKPLPF